jgi:hypothetical protein
MKLLIIGVLLVLTAVTMLGQAAAINGEIEGTITDPSGSVVPRVKVEVVNDGTGYKRSVETNENGFFRFPLLPLGTYTMTADVSGFAQQKRTQIALSAGSTATINLQLAVATQDRTVIVTAEAPVVEPGRTDIGSTVSTNTLVNVALVSRNPYNFILIQPNVSGSPNVEFGVPRKVNANGFSDRINYQLDGGNNTQSDRAGIRLTPFSNTYIAEVQQVNNGFAPEFGNTVGTVFNAITKSGANAFHGEAAYIFRRTDMVARSTLLARTQPKPDQNVNNEFVNVGGRVIKDKVFFFGAWEHIKRDLPQPVTVTPATIATLGLPAAFANAIPFGQNVTFLLAKADYQITQNHRLSVRYSYFRNESPFNNGGGLTLQSQTYLFKDRAPAVAAQLISIFGPSVVNEFRFGIPRRYQRQVAGDFTGAPPTINISGVANFGASDQTGVRFIETTPEWSDNLTYNRRNHSYKFGGDFRLIQDDQVSNTFARYTFPSIATYQAAVAGAALKGYSNFTQSFGNPELKYNSLFTGLFVQDSWKARPNLTLNYGIRYDVYKIPDADSTSLLLASQQFSVDKNNFAPRIGLAYGLGNDQKTVIRVNAGIFYDAPQTNVYYRALLNNGKPQYFTVSTGPGATFAPAFPTSFAAVPSGFSLPTQDITTVSPNFRTLYSSNANVQVSREIAPNLGVSIAYLFTKGTHLPVYRNINLIASGATLADGRPIFGTGRLNPLFNNISMAESVGSSNYNGLNITAMKRFARGYEIFASYTWSHALDDAPEQNVLDVPTGTNATNLQPSDPTNRRRDYGNSLTDRRHVFTSSAVLNPSLSLGSRGLNYLANHNQLGFTFIARSGDIFSEGSNVNLNNDPTIPAILQRPLFIGRDTIRGPKVFQMDVRYSRIFPVGERWKPEFFAEAWNVFNHSNVSGSGTGQNTTATVDATGKIIAPPTFLQINALDPRLLQLGFKLTF